MLGFLMRRYDHPLAPVILGIVLGPLSDNNFRRAMIMSDGSLLGIVARPGTAVILFAFLFFALPFLLRLYARASGQKDVAELVETAVG